MKVAVTGASGFIGKNFVLNVPKQWETFGFYNFSLDFLDFIKKNRLEKVSPIKVNLTNESEVKKLKNKVGSDFDVVLYLASNSDPAYSVKQPASDLNSNVGGLINFFNNFKCKKLIYFSSGAVYDGLSGLVGPESKLNPKLPYAISKLTAEQYIKFFEKKGNINGYSIIRFFGAFGPYEPKRKIYTNLINELHFKDKNEFTIRGNGKNYIDAMYINDTITGIFKMIEKGEGNNIFDFGSGNPLTINNLVTRVAKVFGKEKIKIKHKGSVPECNQFYMSNKIIEKEFSFFLKFTLEKGIKKFTQFLHTT